MCTIHTYIYVCTYVMCAICTRAVMYSLHGCGCACAKPMLFDMFYSYITRTYNTNRQYVCVFTTHCNTLQHTATYCDTLQHTS